MPKPPPAPRETRGIENVLTRLRQGENRFVQLADNIPESFWLIDIAARRVVYANPAFRQLWRLEEDDTPAGMTLGDLVQRIASDPQRLPDPYQREHLFLDDGLQWELRQSDERLLTQTSVAVPAASGQTEEGESRLWIFEDITHERQTADRLL